MLSLFEVMRDRVSLFEPVPQTPDSSNPSAQTWGSPRIRRPSDGYKLIVDGDIII